MPYPLARVLTPAEDSPAMPTKRCPLCYDPIPNSMTDYTGPGAQVDCDTCGPFRFSERLAYEPMFQGWLTGTAAAPTRKLVHASGAVRELNDLGGNVFVEDIDALLTSVRVPVDPVEQIERVLLWIVRRLPAASDWVTVRLREDRSVSYAGAPEEFAFLLAKAGELGLLERAPDAERYRLTLEGWLQARNLKRARHDAAQAFVAMWFHPDVGPAFEEGIRPALEATGFRPLRIDLAEHNDKIDDRIIAEIRKSGLLIADFTGHRSGVYFEAGFALGLGLPVIWCCHADHLSGLHFDTRQYNHIVWTSPEDLRRRLQARIEATLPARRNS